VELTVRDPELGVTGHLVVWSTLAARKGPLGACGKGGTRLTPTVDVAELKMLSRIQTLKNAAAGLALGGAKSGLAADPNEPGFEKKYRRFVQLLKPMLRENGGLWGGFGYDLGGNPIHCKWACEELGSTTGFTGKPVELGGTDYDAEGIAGLGVAVAAQTLLEVKKARTWAPSPARCRAWARWVRGRDPLLQRDGRHHLLDQRPPHRGHLAPSGGTDPLPARHPVPDGLRRRAGGAEGRRVHLPGP
jgi:hypothetical protein